MNCGYCKTKMIYWTCPNCNEEYWICSNCGRADKPHRVYTRRPEEKIDGLLKKKND